MITIKNLNSTELEEVTQWPIWTKEPCTFDHDQEKTESFFIVDGQATLTSSLGDKVNISPGDFVTVQCDQIVTWEIHQSIKKHYKFFE